MATLLHGRLQHRDVRRRIGAVPPRQQGGLGAAPVACVAGLARYGNVLARLRCSGSGVGCLGGGC